MAKTVKKDATNSVKLKAQKRTSSEVYVIRTGASADSLYALSALLNSAPNDNVAYVIVQQLSSEHRSFLQELLEEHSILEKVDAKQNLLIEPNKVYVITNDKDLTVKGNQLQLTEKNFQNSSKTIDDAEEANISLRLSQHRELLKAVLQAQEDERKNISEALHNGLGQILYAAKLNLDQLKPQNKQEQAIVKKMDSLLTESIQVNRNISFELTPSVLKDFGFKAALKEIISRFSSSNLKLTFKTNGFDKRLDSFVELSLYRITQELLNNIIKHSQATKASIDLTCADNVVTLVVQDNGIGFEKQELKSMKGIGLRSIQNRLELLNGELEIDSKRGKGTTFRLECNI